MVRGGHAGSESVGSIGEILLASTMGQAEEGALAEADEQCPECHDQALRLMRRSEPAAGSTGAYTHMPMRYLSPDGRDHDEFRTPASS
ncbi:hypothetical protein [Nocardia sp. NPDC006630]|uniref:hypothetical protein n=1 Tax=Nocardia sp. NPDC006630 TaxID=3157181 RepID=UPI0033BB26DA